MTKPIVCANCQKLLHWQSDDLSESGLCGECQSKTNPAIRLNRDNWESVFKVEQDHLWVYFWAPWCAPCKKMTPVIEELARSEKLNWQLSKVDMSQDAVIGAQFQVLHLPTQILFQSGKEVARLTGSKVVDQIAIWLEKHAKSS